MPTLAPPPLTRPPVTVPTRRARVDAAVRAAALTVLWGGGALLVTYWWAADGGIQDLGGGPETALDSAGRLTGLQASLLLLVQVLLMARVPVLERAFGQERLARVHRWVGFTSFDLMLAHVVLITWGYAAGELSRTPATLWELTVDHPGMLLAVTGTVCLVLVVVTSVRAARRRLRYESWHLLHLYAYLGVGLALPHQLWTGQDFTGSTGRTVFWWGLYLAATGAVLMWRVGLPAWRTVRAGLRVTAVVPEADDVVSVYMTGRPGGVTAEAGQFYGFRFLSGRGWTRAHPYSLSAAPDGTSLRITVRVVGDGSAELRSLRPGTRVLVEGPYGRLSARARTRPRVALIGAGVGITPLRALAEALEYVPGDAALIHRYTGTPLFPSELAWLAAHRGLQVVAVPGHRRAPGSWLGSSVGSAPDVAVLTSWLPDLAERDVFVCGPEAWAADVRRTCLAAGLPPDRFHVESFGW
ncbi:ferric reductase-like transmembrane domain-containing protein [Blastococcus sp. TF02A-26]|uniref:ferredoxin reductase family protein n=1 Tax=Blastococcus sp. TF02A-26 TaxID=2250577 RepID=UPI000DE83808|nr:ferredoxin reductase family protein [Blastococcus sp. TF02A-26]RBY87008.1 oxidoreductase [Blastococcus sp. TF02A-26]